MNEELYKRCGFTGPYREEMEEFYLQYFSTKEEMFDFFDLVFENEAMNKAPRRMANQVARLIELVRDLRQLRPGKDAFAVLYVRVCIESLCKLKKLSGFKNAENEKNSFLNKYFLDKQYYY